MFGAPRSDEGWTQCKKHHELLHHGGVSVPSTLARALTTLHSPSDLSLSLSLSLVASSMRIQVDSLGLQTMQQVVDLADTGFADETAAAQVNDILVQALETMEKTQKTAGARAAITSVTAAIASKADIRPIQVRSDSGDMPTDGVMGCLTAANESTDAKNRGSSNIEQPGEPQELPWGGPGTRTGCMVKSPPSTVLELPGIKTALPTTRLFKGSARGAGRMTMTVDGPLDRSLPDPYFPRTSNRTEQTELCMAPSLVAPRSLRSVDVTVKLLVQTVSRRELHYHYRNTGTLHLEDILEPGTGRPTLPKIVSKSEASSAVNAESISGAVHSCTWEQLSVWCQAVVTDIELVLWIDTSRREASNRRALYYPGTMNQRDVRQFVHVVESTPAWGAVQACAWSGSIREETVSTEEHAAAVGSVATSSEDETDFEHAQNGAPDYGLKLIGAPWLDYAEQTIGVVMAAYRTLPAARTPAPPHRPRKWT